MDCVTVLQSYNFAYFLLRHSLTPDVTLMAAYGRDNAMHHGKPWGPNSLNELLPVHNGRPEAHTYPYLMSRELLLLDSH